MLQINKLSISILFIFLFIGCGNLELSPVGYLEWIRKNKDKFTLSKTIDNFQYQAFYKTSELVSIEQSSVLDDSSNSLNDKIELNKNLYYFIFRIRTTDNTELLYSGVNNEDQYYKRLNYFTSHAKSDFLLYNGIDSLKCVLYHFERNYGVAPFNNILIVFENDKKTTNKNDLTLIYNDRIFGSGPVKLTLDNKVLKSIPKLKLNKDV